MKFSIMASKKDTAGMNIAQELEKLNFKINYFDKEIIHAEAGELIWQNINNDFVIFISKHQGRQEKMLSLHAPGNWRDAKFGGIAGKVCPTSARVLKIFFQELNKNVPQGWQATMECTHHGPYIEKPCLFIEIGSSAKDWPDKEAGRAIARTIKNSIDRINSTNEKYDAAVGIGGPHYCPNFNKIQASSDYAIGHIIPEYIFPIDEKIIIQAIKKTIEPAETIILDWKGLGNSESRKQVLEILKKFNLKVLRTSEIEK